MISPNGIAHIQLTVRDVGASRPFYHRLLVEAFGMSITASKTSMVHLTVVRYRGMRWTRCTHVGVPRSDCGPRGRTTAPLVCRRYFTMPSLMWISRTLR